MTNPFRFPRKPRKEAVQRLAGYSVEYFEALSKHLSDVQIEFCHDGPKVPWVLIFFDFVGCNPIFPEWNEDVTLRSFLSIQNKVSNILPWQFHAIPSVCQPSSASLWEAQWFRRLFPIIVRELKSLFCVRIPFFNSCSSSSQSTGPGSSCNPVKIPCSHVRCIPAFADSFMLAPLPADFRGTQSMKQQKNKSHWSKIMASMKHHETKTTPAWPLAFCTSSWVRAKSWDSGRPRREAFRAVRRTTLEHKEWKNRRKWWGLYEFIENMIDMMRFFGGPFQYYWCSSTVALIYAVLSVLMLLKKCGSGMFTHTEPHVENPSSHLNFEGIWFVQFFEPSNGLLKPSRLQSQKPSRSLQDFFSLLNGTPPRRCGSNVLTLLGCLKLLWAPTSARELTTLR